MTKRRRQGMAGSILEQFAELKSDYEIGKASRYKRAKTGIMTLGAHADYHYRTESAYFGAMEMAREMTRNNPLVMQGVRRLVANVVGRGFVLDSDSGDKGIDDVNGYRWAEWSRSPEACDDHQELDRQRRILGGLSSRADRRQRNAPGRLHRHVWRCSRHKRHGVDGGRQGPRHPGRGVQGRRHARHGDS
jgi:hypothetical protein